MLPSESPLAVCLNVSLKPNAYDLIPVLDMASSSRILCHAGRYNRNYNKATNNLHPLCGCPVLSILYIMIIYYKSQSYFTKKFMPISSA